MSTLLQLGWERWAGHSPTGPLSSLLLRKHRDHPGEIILWKSERERIGVRVPTALPGKVMLQADLVADVADAQEGLRAGLCTAMLR